MKILTILIPAYNSSKTIARTLDSLNLEFNSKDIDVLIIDDGSKDDTQSICNEYAKKYKCIKYVKQENGNYGSVINHAKKYTNSRYIRTLDSDDTLVTTNLTTYISKLKEMPSNVDIVFTNHNFVNFETNKVIKNSLTTWFKLTQKDLICSLDKIIAPKYASITIHSITFSNELFQQIKQLPENIFYSDSYLVFQLFKFCRDICYIPHLYIYNYFVFNNNQSINIYNMVKNKEHVLTVFKYMVEDNISSSTKRKKLSWIYGVMRLVIKFNFLVLSFDNILTNQEKDEQLKYILSLIKQYVTDQRQLYYVLDSSLRLMFSFKMRTMSKLIKIGYNIGVSKFSRATKSKVSKINKKSTIIGDSKIL